MYLAGGLAVEQRLERRAKFVAQIFNLPYRRVALGRALRIQERIELTDVLRIANPRYSRVQLCATGLVGRSHVGTFTTLPEFDMHRVSRV